ncbi:hypothetical protein T484DRAFT_1977825 [Baffinella frigidus]|nr:hypothetical protein T484DRAFT_1977825 [Cryptophyta sp. CCMP2293]
MPMWPRQRRKQEMLLWRRWSPWALTEASLNSRRPTPRMETYRVPWSWLSSGGGTQWNLRAEDQSPRTPTNLRLTSGVHSPTLVGREGEKTGGSGRDCPRVLWRHRAQRSEESCPEERPCRLSRGVLTTCAPRGGRGVLATCVPRGARTTLRERKRGGAQTPSWS